MVTTQPVDFTESLISLTFNIQEMNCSMSSSKDGMSTTQSSFKIADATTTLSINDNVYAYSFCVYEDIQDTRT